jgi:hypothetical protein
MSWTSAPALGAPSGADERQQLQRALHVLEAEAYSFGIRFINDAAVRAEYMQGVSAAARDLLRRAETGTMSYAAAAAEANLLRNELMEIARGRTSEMMAAYARSLKREGLTLEALVRRHAKELFDKAPEALSRTERDAVMRRILEGAARSRSGVNAAATRLGRLGRVLFWASIGIAFYNVLNAEHPGQQAVKEGAILGSGLLGSIAGGAAAGLVCGPAAPVCSGIGVVVGGALFAFGASWALD